MPPTLLIYTRLLSFNLALFNRLSGLVDLSASANAAVASVAVQADRSILLFVVLFLLEVEIYDSVHIGQGNEIVEVVINCLVDLGQVDMTRLVGVVPLKQVAYRGHHLV